MIFLFQIGFLPITIWDFLDVLIVGFLIYQIYKILKGTIAFNIFIGVVLFYAVWWLVGALKMDLLSTLLGQFVNVGVITLLIVFQPEIRKFFLLLGNTTLSQRSNFWNRLFNVPLNDERQEIISQKVQAVKTAIMRMSKNKTGALIIFTNNLNLEGFNNSGIVLDAEISSPLLESIFNKESPLHDGAVIVANDKIHAASCILPVSDNPNLRQSDGLRHRAGLGVSENTSVAVFIVSEENGQIAFAHEGKLSHNLSEVKLTELLLKHYF
ncbi:MAG: diadenylate cyclase CdaA [Saprospiraceae bacterium]